jgi:hypothetical protein
MSYMDDWEPVPPEEAERIKAEPRKGYGAISPLTQALLDGKMVHLPKARTIGGHYFSNKGLRLVRKSDGGEGVYVWTEPKP